MRLKLALLPPPPTDQALAIANDVDLSQVDADLQAQIAQAHTIELDFPKFTDGRAYSQAVVLRRRLGFQGILRARGQIALDSLQQIARTGFDQVLLDSAQSVAAAQKILAQYAAFYQGDAVQAVPHFARPAT